MGTQRDHILESWDKFLHPQLLKGNLIVASLFLAAYETFIMSVVCQLKGWYSMGFGDDPCKLYQESVLSLHKKQLQASLLWFQNMGAIDDSDIDLAKRITDHRNELAHELPRFLATADSAINLELLRSISYLVSKIDRWWIREIEIPCYADLDSKDVDAVSDDEIHSGNMLFLQMMIEIATGDELDVVSQHNAFIEGAKNVAGKRAAQTA
jgi:hypothetical protein